MGSNFIAKQPFRPLPRYIAMELFPILYLVALGIVADYFGAFRTIGTTGAYVLMLFLTPLLGVPLVLLFPRLPKAYCLQDYKNFHAGIAYRFRKVMTGNTSTYLIVNDITIGISEYEFTEYFALVESRRAYKKRRKEDGFR